MDCLNKGYVQIHCFRHSCLGLILSSEHVVDLGEVVRAGENGLGIARRLVVLCQVGMLPEEAHLGKSANTAYTDSILGDSYIVVSLGREDVSRVQTLVKVKFLHH